MLPTLLCEKLVNHYVDFDNDTKSDLAKLKIVLKKVVGQTNDRLMAVISREQHTKEKVEDFTAALKKLFKQAYLSEALT